MFCVKHLMVWILKLPQEQVRAKRLLSLQSWSQRWFQVVLCNGARAVPIMDARWNWIRMLSFKGCPEANTYFLYSMQLISDWQRTALKSVMIPCFLISWMKNLSTQILKPCIELTSKKFLYSFQQYIKERVPVKSLVISNHVSTEESA